MSWNLALGNFGKNKRDYTMFRTKGIDFATFGYVCERREQTFARELIRRLDSKLNLITRPRAVRSSFSHAQLSRISKKGRSTIFSLSGDLKGRLVLPGSRTSRSESTHVRQSQSAFGNDRRFRGRPRI